jgi:C-terminal processing protease CtpA/Prc
MVQKNSVVSSVPYTFRTLPDKNIGIIEFNQFTDLNKFKAFLDSAFQVLQKENIENLIIDIRKNGGGNSSLGDELFQYISPAPFAQFGKMIMKYSDVQKRFYKTSYNQDITNPNGFKIYNNKNTELKLIKLRKNPLRYKNNVFLLISHYTFSSAASFSWAFKYFKMGTVIGEESGGMAVCFGDVIFLNLPNTGLRYGCSHKKFYMYGADDNNIHGTLPDYTVEAEKALDFTIDLIRKKK